jgi:hypothetical protein
MRRQTPNRAITWQFQAQGAMRLEAHAARRPARLARPTRPRRTRRPSAAAHGKASLLHHEEFKGSGVFDCAGRSGLRAANKDSRPPSLSRVGSIGGLACAWHRRRRRVATEIARSFAGLPSNPRQCSCCGAPSLARTIQQPYTGLRRMFVEVAPRRAESSPA